MGPFMTQPAVRQAAAPSTQFQEQYYSNRWKDFTHANQLELARMAKALELLAQIELPSNPKICDLGCGVGWSTSIVGIFGEATGVDLSETSHAQTRYPHCRFESVDILKWDAPESEFDVVLSLEVIEHVEEAQQGGYLAVARRILKPQGHLILTTPNRRTMNAIPGGGTTWSSQPVEDWLDAKRLRSLLKQGGFTIMSMTSFLLGVGQSGFYRLVNSSRVNKFAKSIGVARTWQWAACRANYGLHFAVLARRNGGRSEARLR